MVLKTLADGVTNKWIFLNKDNERFLLKDSLYIYSKEPYAEVIVSSILEYLNLPHIKYNLYEIDRKTNSKHLSICKLKNNIFKLTDLIEIPNYDLEPEEFVGLVDNIFNLKELFTMLTVDALIANPDRHLGNIHIFNDNTIIFLDQGQSLNAMNNFEMASNYWRSNPLLNFHDDQISFIKEYCINKKIDYNFEIIRNLEIEKLITYLDNKSDLRETWNSLTLMQKENIFSLLRETYNRISNIIGSNKINLANWY